ncbi:hypothetical protein [Luteipulveratus flavus]|uniref:Lipoprotein n=1 Tax=Luteipulveratus flavus TaxID=3031728 RepID=A0ABT6C2P9_9MICO|nr:hypothetical protein [Luteipulveratus sp. YIM 133296]MDF8263219.1 hypothetical protein [Luteipulveratus sp. YIM 133296]
MSRSRRRALAATAALAPLTLVVVACSGQGSVEAPHVRAAATAFVRTTSVDPGSACALLAPVTAREVADDAPCAAGLADAGLPPAGEIRSVQVYGKDAVVHTSADTLFLARFDRGWLITAAGCRPQGEDLPYDCDVKGG